MLLMRAHALSDVVNALLHGIDRVRAESQGFASKVHASGQPSSVQKMQAHFCFGLVGQVKNLTNLSESS